MFIHLAARVPPGEACADVMQVMTRHRIAFSCSTNPDDVAPFLKNSGSKEDGSLDNTLPKNSADQANSFVDQGRPSFTPNFHLETKGFGNSDAQVNASPNALKVPQAIHVFSGRKQVNDAVMQFDAFSKSPEAQQLLLDYYRQKQATDTVSQNTPTNSTGTGVFGQDQQLAPISASTGNPLGSTNIASDLLLNQQSFEKAPTGTNISTKQPEAQGESEQSSSANKADVLSKILEQLSAYRADLLQKKSQDTVIQKTPPATSGTDVSGHQQQQSSLIFTTPENRFRSGNVVPVNPQPMDFDMPSFASPAPMLHDEPIDIFDGIKPPIDLDAPHLFLGEIDLTEDPVEKTAVKKEIEDEAEEFGDAGQHLDPKDNEPKPKNPPPSSTGTNVFGREQQHSSSILSTPPNRFGNGNAVNAVRDPSPQPMDFEMDPIGTNNAQPLPVSKEKLEFKTASVKKAPAPMSFDDSDDDDVKPFKPLIPPMDPNHRVLFDVDLSEDSDESVVEDSGDESENSDEMEDEEEHISDSGAHLDPKDKAYKPYKPKSRLSKKKSTPQKKSAHNKMPLPKKKPPKKSGTCEVCKKVLSDKNNLKKHMLIHSGEKPFECDVCQKRFRIKPMLTLHLRTHTGEKPFECEVCKTRFADPSTLRRHKRTHTGERPYECKKCQKKFTEKKNLKGHCTRFHS